MFISLAGHRFKNSSEEILRRQADLFTNWKKYVLSNNNYDLLPFLYLRLFPLFNRHTLKKRRFEKRESQKQIQKERKEEKDDEGIPTEHLSKNGVSVRL